MTYKYGIDKKAGTAWNTLKFLPGQLWNNAKNAYNGAQGVVNDWVDTAYNDKNFQQALKDQFTTANGWKQNLKNGANSLANAAIYGVPRAAQMTYNGVMDNVGNIGGLVTGSFGRDYKPWQWTQKARWNSPVGGSTFIKGADPLSGRVGTQIGGIGAGMLAGIAVQQYGPQMKAQINHLRARAKGRARDQWTFLKQLQNRATGIADKLQNREDFLNFSRQNSNGLKSAADIGRDSLNNDISDIMSYAGAAGKQSGQWVRRSKGTYRIKTPSSPYNGYQIVRGMDPRTGLPYSAGPKQSRQWLRKLKAGRLANVNDQYVATQGQMFRSLNEMQRRLRHAGVKQNTLPFRSPTQAQRFLTVWARAKQRHLDSISGVYRRIPSSGNLSRRISNVLQPHYHLGKKLQSNVPLPDDTNITLGAKHNLQNTIKQFNRGDAMFHSGTR